jgi:hypothetical protein
MTTTGIEFEGFATGSETRTAAENVPASRHHDGGQIRVPRFDPAEQRTSVRHLVLFPARVL